MDLAIQLARHSKQVQLADQIAELKEIKFSPESMERTLINARYNNINANSNNSYLSTQSIQGRSMSNDTPLRKSFSGTMMESPGTLLSNLAKSTPDQRESDDFDASTQITTIETSVEVRSSAPIYNPFASHSPSTVQASVKPVKDYIEAMVQLVKPNNNNSEKRSMSNTTLESESKQKKARTTSTTSTTSNASNRSNLSNVSHGSKQTSLKSFKKAKPSDDSQEPSILLDHNKENQEESCSDVLDTTAD